MVDTLVFINKVILKKTETKIGLTFEKHSIE